MRAREHELKALTDQVVTTLAEAGQSDLVIEMADHYFMRWAKEKGQIDEFLFKISLYAFVHSSEERRFNFLVEVIKFTKNGDPALIHALAEGYKAKEDYLHAYVYYIAGNKPIDVAILLKEHIFSMGYASERDYFVLRACLEFVM